MGPGGGQLESSFNNRSKPSYQKELGNAIGMARIRARINSFLTRRSQFLQRCAEWLVSVLSVVLPSKADGGVLAVSSLKTKREQNDLGPNCIPQGSHGFVLLH